ncbi:ArsR family transcriptional regulator [Psychrobacter sp. I-STPA10]|uniref:ArsR family transcriptional regulator n=1 Tax=Psychrobacter sp. I-STPA10 TaxID=2585769 RepID=UPI001E2F327D|nr:ArsR family transcriptional regulator [Psychrobacter sp. I-STPA10]
MNLQQLQTEDHRRSVLWFLLYDPDYQLSEQMLYQCFEMQGKSISYDQLRTHNQWLCEQGLTTSTPLGAINNIALTDRGLEVAKGMVRAVGVRNLRPSEIADIKSFKGY